MRKAFIYIFGLLIFSSCVHSRKPPIIRLLFQTTKATYYSDRFIGRKTANGEIFVQTKFTAANNEFPFGTEVVLIDLETKKRVTIRINDTGKLGKGVKFDLTKAAFKKLNKLRKGVINVSYQAFLKPSSLK